MTFQQLEDYFKDKRNCPCPLTDRFIKAGYQQDNTTGYIEDAKKAGMVIDYRLAEPNQWWHIMNYCKEKEKSKNVPYLSCGELVFWMAEISEAVSKDKLENLLHLILQNGTPIKSTKETSPKVMYDRKKCNNMIKDLCWEQVVRTVENSTNGNQ